MQVKSMLSEDDKRFIAEVDRRFPDKNIAESFDFFLALPANQRITRAKERRKSLLRAGWVQCGIPVGAVETLDQHVNAMRVMAKRELKADMLSADLLTMIDIHDDGELITSDFTPGEGLSEKKKARLEDLAIQVIYESQPEVIEKWRDVEYGRTTCALIVKDIDKLQMFERCFAYAITHPDVDLSDFERRYQSYKCKTSEGRSIYGVLRCALS